MKSIFISTACIIAGFSSFAAETAPKKQPATKPAQIVAATKPQANSAFRRQMSFTFYDPCGQQMTVWVSGPSTGLNSGNSTFYLTALEYANGTRTADGCFPR